MQRGVAELEEQPLLLLCSVRVSGARLELSHVSLVNPRAVCSPRFSPRYTSYATSACGLVTLVEPCDLAQSRGFISLEEFVRVLHVLCAFRRDK